MTISLKISLLSALILGLFSCTETMDIDLNDTDTQIVIEANVSTLSAPTVVLTSSINFDESNDFPTISNAYVSLTDNNGTTEILTEISEGTYSSSQIIGEINKTYTLYIEVDGKTFYSSCQILNQVAFDSITVIKTLETSLFGDENDSIYEVTVHFQDPVNIDNYYLFVEYRNGEQVKSYTFSDKSSDGIYLDRKLRYGDRELINGDTLTIEMRCITEAVYNYFNDLGSNTLVTATPTNPKSNITNATLGYFSAHTSALKYKVIQE